MTQREIDRGRQIALTGERERGKFIVTLCVRNHTVILQCPKYAEPHATSEGMHATTVNCCFGYILSGTVLQFYVMLLMHIIYFTKAFDSRY